MTRVTPAAATANETAWQPDHWYRVRLQEWSDAGRKGTPGFQNKPRKHDRIEVQWSLAGTDDLVFDWIDLTVSPRRDGTHSMCKLLICALAGRDPRHEATPWVDTDTLEFGFGADAATDAPAGRIVIGVEVALKGEVTTKDGIDRLDVKRYGPAHLAGPASPQQVAGPAAVLSADGRWVWNGSQWIPAPPPAALAPAPPPQPQPAPVQTELL